VHIYERAANPRELGFALILTPNAIAALGELGVTQAMLTKDVPAEARDPKTILVRHTANFDARFQAIARATAPEDLRFDELFERDFLDDWRGRSVQGRRCAGMNAPGQRGRAVSSSSDAGSPR